MNPTSRPYTHATQAIQVTAVGAGGDAGSLGFIC